VGASRRVVQDWEAGVNVPGADRLQVLIVVLFSAGGLRVGGEADEVHALWAAALAESSRMRTPLDEAWLRGVLTQQAPERGMSAPLSRPATVRGVARRQDWGEAPDVIGFVGRADELEMGSTWIVQEHIRLLAVLGMGGIGKTTLAARLAQDVASTFECVYWRSLRDARPTTEWLAGAIDFISDHQLVPPLSESERLSTLLQMLRERRTLLVLDNFEALLEPGHLENGYRQDAGGYGRVLQAVGERRHDSCLLLTSREAPPELSSLAGGAVRTFELGGLQPADARLLLAHHQLAGSADQWDGLIRRFGGNGLALKVVGERIRQLFGGEIGAFLKEESGAGTVFGSIRRLLAEQLDGGSALEHDALRVLAVAREPVGLAELLSAIGHRAERGAVLDVVEALRRRSLIERTEIDGTAAFTLQPVVLEYVTSGLVETVADELAGEAPVEQVVVRPLVKAQATDYVRQTQERLIGAPVLLVLNARYGERGTEERLLALLEDWRGRPPAEQGYGPGNVVNLLRLLRGGDLRGMDLSRLAVRQAYLAGVEAQGASLAGADLVDAVLAEAFRPPFMVALGGDGAHMALGTSTGELWLFEVADRTALLGIQAHTGAIRGVAFSRDGQLIASGGDDGTARLWEVPSGRSLATLRGHTGAVWGIAFAEDGQLLASGSADGTVRLWDVPGGRSLAVLRGHTSAIRGVASSEDGRLLASGSDDGTVRLWELPSGRSLVTLHGHSSAVWGVALSADGRLLASGSDDGAIRLWEAPGGRSLAALRGHTSTVYSVALSGDGRLVASGGADAAIRLWEAPSGRSLSALRGHTSTVYGVSLSGDGQLLASSSADGTVRLWGMPSGRSLAALRGHTGSVFGVALSGDGRLLASGSADGTVRLREVPSGQSLATLRGHTSTVWGVALSGDGRLLASGGVDGTVRLWGMPGAQSLATLRGHTSTVWSVALSMDGRLVASGSADGTVRLWEAPSGRLLATLQGHSSAIRGVALSMDGRLVASGSADGTVRLWEAPGGRLLATLRGHSSTVWGVALSGDGRLLASGGVDGKVRLWEVPGGRELATLHGHTSTVIGVALSADGQLLASGGGDGTVRLWEAPSGHQRATLHGHTSTIISVALSADGRLLASGSGDGTVRLWETSRGTSVGALGDEPCYERLDITGLTGVTGSQRAALLALGAVERPGGEPTPIPT
jgi:WD40 repeat protein